MEKIPTPQQPDDIQKEADVMYEKELKDMEIEFIEALAIKKAVKLISAYIEKGFLSQDMPLIEALEKIEKRQLEIAGVDPEAEQDGDEEEGEEKGL